MAHCFSLEILILFETSFNVEQDHACIATLRHRASCSFRLLQNIGHRVTVWVSNNMNTFSNCHVLILGKKQPLLCKYTEKKYLYS